MELISLLQRSFEEQRDLHTAAQQAAYMRNLFPFLGIKKPVRSIIQKELFKKYQLLSKEDLTDHLLALWDLQEREYQMAALDLAYSYKKIWTPDLIELFEHLVRTKSWWDSVDTLAAKLIGPLVQKYPELQDHMDRWIDDPCIWVRRSALIYQLSYKNQTDQVRLFTYCERRMHEKEFFIRKAIGWALRQYAYTEPDAVYRFVEQAKDSLSPLSYREATKHLKRLR
jgi:3-methyladenine DNA glycosylase AlkD